MYTSLELNDIGALLLSRGEFGMAIEALGQAYSLDNNNPQIICNLANAYASNNKLYLAKQYFGLALELEPFLFEALHSLGFINLQEGNKREAVKYFEKALSIHESNDLIINLAYAYRDVDSLKAKKYFEKAVLLSPDDVTLHFSLANVYVDLEEYLTSQNYLENMIKMFPDYAKAYSLLNYVYTETLEWEKSKKTLSKLDKFLKTSLKNNDLAVTEEPLMNIFRMDNPKINYKVAIKKAYEKNFK